MKTIRSALLLCLTVFMALSLFACGYKPVASTEEEAATVMTLDGKYEVPYELFRFIFLQKKQAVSDGNDDYFVDKDKKALFAEFASEAEAEAVKVYAMFSLCEKYGIDPYSKEIEDEIKEAVAFAIEGDDFTPGYGSYKNYLADIKEKFLNDSVYRLYLRYDACEAHLAAKLKKDKVITANRDDVLAYYCGDETVCATWILIPYQNLANYTEGMRQNIWNEAVGKSNEDFKLMAAQYATTQSAEELATGLYFGRYEYDVLYRELVDTAFSLAEGETSEPFYSGDGLYIVRRLPKNLEYLADESNRDALDEGYMLNVFGRMLAEEEQRLASAVSYTERYRALHFDAVKKPE